MYSQYRYGVKFNELWGLCSGPLEMVRFNNIENFDQILQILNIYREMVITEDRGVKVSRREAVSSSL